MNMPISVDYGAMEEAASQIKASSKTIEDLSSSLKSQLQKIEWEGGDREAYLMQQQKWDQALLDMNNILHQISQAVDTARTGYSDVEQSGVQAWS
jgi:6 kDa early secretory antigenic target